MARSGLVGLVTAAALLILLLVAAAWIVGDEREAVGQPTPATTPATASPSPSSASPSAFADGLEDFSDLVFPSASASASASAQADGPEGIPDLGVMDVVGNLKHYPTRSGFVCAGPVPGNGDEGTLWLCSAGAEGGGGSYDVVLVGDDPLTVLWVRATARGVSDEEAAQFFGYVGELCLGDADPLNADAWVSQNVPTGGQTFADGAELSIYGTDEERTLQVVATDLS